jgi:hypothetical protein
MAFSAFEDKNHEPTDQEVDEVLQGTAHLWAELKTAIASRHKPVVEDWSYSGKNWGWALRLKCKKRVILYLTPCEGFFYAGFALGEKAVAAAHESDLMSPVISLIEGSQKYAEGRAVRLEVRTPEDVENVVSIAAIKMAN